MKNYIMGAVAAIAALLCTGTELRAQTTNTNNVINCDFSVLEDLIDDLEVGDIQAPNDNARRGRLGSLENALDSALEGAEDNDLEEVLDALEHIAAKADANKKNAWLTGDVAEDITDAIDDLRECLDDYDDDDNGNGNEGDCDDTQVRANNRNVTLDNADYECDLVIRGNNNRIVGSSTGNTVIEGNVVITGNNNTLRNVEVLGTITLRGNNIRLDDVDYDGEVINSGNGNQY